MVMILRPLRASASEAVCIAAPARSLKLPGVEATPIDSTCIIQPATRRTSKHLHTDCRVAKRTLHTVLLKYHQLQLAAQLDGCEAKLSHASAMLVASLLCGLLQCVIAPSRLTSFFIDTDGSSDTSHSAHAHAQSQANGCSSCSCCWCCRGHSRRGYCGVFCCSTVWPSAPHAPRLQLFFVRLRSCSCREHVRVLSKGRLPPICTTQSKQS
eukprot:1355118-Pleurochrysis_carterae.AAC.2